MAKASQVDVIKSDSNSGFAPWVSLTAGGVRAAALCGRKIVALKLAIITASSRVIGCLSFLKIRASSIPAAHWLWSAGQTADYRRRYRSRWVRFVRWVRVWMVEMMDDLMQGADRDLVEVWHCYKNEYRFDSIMVNAKTVAVEPKEDGRLRYLWRCKCA